MGPEYFLSSKVQAPELSMLATARYLPGMSNPSYLICFTPPGQKKLPMRSCTASEQKALAEATEAAPPKRTADVYFMLDACVYRCRRLENETEYHAFFSSELCEKGGRRSQGRRLECAGSTSVELEPDESIIRSNRKQTKMNVAIQFDNPNKEESQVESKIT